MKKGTNCCAQVQTKGLMMHYHRCFNLAVVTRRGQHYCKVHDPVYRREKRERKMAQYSAENAREQRRWDRAGYTERLLKLCEAIAAGHIQDDHIHAGSRVWMNDIKQLLVRARTQTPRD